MKRTLPAVAAIVVLGLALVAVPIGLVASAFIGNLPIPDRDERDGVTLVKDDFVTSYLLDAGPGQVALTDGQPVTVGTLTVTPYAMAGHTAGSAVFLADDALFFGDSAGADSGGALKPAPWVFTDDTAQNRAALVALSGRLDEAGTKVRRMYFGHTGPVEGSDALRTFAAAK